MPGSGQQFALLGPAYAGCSTSEIGAGAQANFHKNQRRTILHDQVDFAETAAVILVQQRKSVLLQEFRR